MATAVKPNLAGPLSFGVGIIIAIAGATKLPADGTKWPDTWPIFLIGALLSVAGIVLWRMAEAKQDAAAAPGEDGKSDPLELLQAAVPAVKAVEADFKALTSDALCERIDAVLQDFIVPAAEARQDLVKKLGMERGAEILVTAAYAERMLNRVWSASADGHLPEAGSSLTEAAEAIQQTAELAAAAK